MSDYLNSRKGLFNSSDNKETDKNASEAITKRIYNDIHCFEGMFSLLVKESSHTYQAVPRRVAYALPKPLKEELEWLQK